MAILNENERALVQELVTKIARGRRVKAACLYGSRIAGYARKDSDIDLLLVLEHFPYGVTYDYHHGKRGNVSALIVGDTAVQKDASIGLLGEFVVGRLLHIYEPLEGAKYLADLETLYKKRVILEQIQDLVSSTGTLCMQIKFPLEYIHFSRVKRRALHYPAAAYSFYKTYTESTHLAKNIESSLAGYRRALEDIVQEDPTLFSTTGDLLQISESSIYIEKGTARLRLSNRLQQLSSYIFYSYAGLKVMHRSIGEAESKIKRRLTDEVHVPRTISDPKGVYCQLPEGILISGENGDWIDDYVSRSGIGKYSIAYKKRLGNNSSKTVLYVLRSTLDDQKDGGEKRLAVKNLAVSKSIKWSALNVWTAPVKRYNVDPLSLLGSEYNGLRYIRQIGLLSPPIEAVVLDKRLIITSYIPGRTLAEVIREFLKDRSGADLIALAGKQIAKVHLDGSSFGNIKPKNIIENNGDLFFTDLAQFARSSVNDQPWDLAQFISWALKRTRLAEPASEFVRQFLSGYQTISGSPQQALSRLARSRKHLELFYPVLSPQVATAIKREIQKLAS